MGVLSRLFTSAKAVILLNCLCRVSHAQTHTHARTRTRAHTPISRLIPTNLRVDGLEAKHAVGVDPTRPRLSWGFELDGKGPAEALEPPQVSIELRERSANGNILRWNTSIIRTRSTEYQGSPLLSGTQYTWQLCITESTCLGRQDQRCATSQFTTGIPGWWANVPWISGKQLRSPKFSISRQIKSAVLSVTGLGCYKIWVNGKLASDVELDPGFSTNLTERILYSTFDVTSLLLNSSSLVLAARVGSGKYSIAASADSTHALIASMSVAYKDGVSQVFVTNRTWKVSASPIVSENIYYGEVFDAKLEEPGWNTADFDDDHWNKADEIVPPVLGRHAEFSPRLFPPIRVVKAVEPVNVTNVGNYSWVVDLGNNFAGVGQINLPTGIAAGHIMTLIHTEYPNIAYSPGTPDLYQQQDQYIFSGVERENTTYRASFVYHGFRYIRVENYPLHECPQVVGLFMHSDVLQHGHVTISNQSREGKVLTAIHDAVVQSQACNIYSHPTDCPQREKRGWMGDAQWTAEEALLNFDMTALYGNWIRTMHDLQSSGCTHVPGAGALPMSDGFNGTNAYCCRSSPKGADPRHPTIFYCSPQYNQSDTDGSIPDVVPNNPGRGGSRGWPGSPTWSVAYVIIPGHILQYSNDTSLIMSHYEGIRAHVDFLARQSSFGGGIPQFGLLGDWLAIEPLCPGSSDTCLKDPGWVQGDVTTSFYFLKSVEDLIRMANRIGNTGDVEKYTQLLSRAKAAYHLQFYNPMNKSYGPTQTGNALAIAAAVVPEELMEGPINALTQNILSRNTHLSVGGVGARWILQALSKANRTDLALDLATQETAPSWYDFILAGPGTLHEVWGQPAKNGNPAIEGGSHNHIMFGGGIDPWIFNEIGGLRVMGEAPHQLRLGVECVVMTRAKAAAAETFLHGQRAQSSWEWDGNNFSLTYNSTIPVGMSGVIIAPTTCSNLRLVSAMDIYQQRETLTFASIAPSEIEIGVSSGSHSHVLFYVK